MSGSQLMETYMVPEGAKKTMAATVGHPASRWMIEETQDQMGIAVSVPHLPGVYHVDNLQMLTDRGVLPGTIVFSPATMISLPSALVPGGREDPHHAAIEAQVDGLRAFALDDGEAFDETSAKRALRFCHDLAADHEPAMTLLANGNVRAVWQNHARDQVGIQFFPDGLLQYVMLRDRDGRTLKALGEDVSARKIRATVDAQGMTDLWFNGGR